MEKFYYLILFFIFTKISFSLVPNWNFSSHSIDLLKGKSSYSYRVVDNKYDEGFSYHLIRNFSIKDGKIKQENKLFINETYDYGITEYEDLDSAYPFGDFFYICPKGRFHVYKYRNNQKLEKLLDKGGDQLDWDLNCFHQHDIYAPHNDKKKFLFIFYLNSNKDIYQYYYLQNEFIKNLLYVRIVMDFMLINGG